MHLIDITTHRRIPVEQHRPAGHPHGEMILIRRPAADPYDLGLVPGMEAILVLDDGSPKNIRVGARWAQLDSGRLLRIDVSDVVG